MNRFCRIVFAFALLLLSTVAFAQVTKVRGQVIDAETGEPVPYAAVFFDGTSIGVSTDEDGRYYIETRDTSAIVLTASILGYLPVSVQIARGAFSEVDFSLELDSDLLSAARIRPDDRYGAIVDKKKQTMTVYEYGKKLGTVLISTGETTAVSRKADTHSGAYLMGTRMESFLQDGRYYNYPVRIDGFNLIHQAGYARESGLRDFGEELEALGTRASHGCIRVDPRTWCATMS